MKFYRCKKCGRIKIQKDGEKHKMHCCVRLMEELKPKSEDVSSEKHVPYCEIFGNKVKVRIGEVLHPMEKDHYIEFIGYYANGKFSKVVLKPGDSPIITFEYHEGARVYAYCNKHGLWESEIL